MNMKTVTDFLDHSASDPNDRSRVEEICTDLGVDRSTKLDDFAAIPAVAVRSHLVIALNRYNEEFSHE